MLDDFQSVSAVKTLFEDWKRRHGEQYAQAYCTLTLPDLLAPFVRLEVRTRKSMLTKAGVAGGPPPNQSQDISRTGCLLG